jgi:SAM-dependent methyltransferase
MRENPLVPEAPSTLFPTRKPASTLSSSAMALICPLCLDRPGSKVLVASSSRKMRKCGSCGVIFLDPRPDPRKFSAILVDHYIKDEARLERAFGKTRDSVLSQVAAKILKRKKRGVILDVGCAGGHFLETYFSLPEWQSYGVEPSKFGATRAATRGIQVFRGEISEVELPIAFFDVITVMDVICYILDPQRELGKLRAALKPDGILAIEQSLAGTHLWRHTSRMGKLLGGAPNVLVENNDLFLSHTFLYERKSMNLLLRQAGFCQLEWAPLPANKQGQGYRDFLFRSYYWGSRTIWWLSGNRVMLGPNFVVLARSA